MHDRLKTGLWVEAHVKSCHLRDCPAFVLARGDYDRGGVLLKVDRFSEGVDLYEQTLDFDGNRVWRLLNKGLEAPEASKRVARKQGFDPDLWVVEVEDLRQIYTPDAPVLTDQMP